MDFTTTWFSNHQCQLLGRACDTRIKPAFAALGKGERFVKEDDIVRDDVWNATNRRQQPFSYGSLPGREDFYFVAGN